MSLATFAAIDFETADGRPISACALGVVRVVGGEVVERFKSLIRPPPSSFRFARLHGITRAEASHARRFADVWSEARGLVDGVRFIAAHHAPFDVRVLHQLCMRSSIRPPAVSFVCSYLLAERLCGAGNGRLPVACAKLGIPLTHHDPLSDAEASAAIVLAAHARGIRVPAERSTSRRR